MNIEYIGYHGTLKNIEKCIKSGGFTKSNTGWLGEGVYFFQDDFELAKRWAIKKYNAENVVFIKRTIRVEREKLFDITYPLSEQSKYYFRERERCIQEMKKRGYKVDVESRKRYENGLINLICVTKKYHVVRACTYTYQKCDYIDGNEVGSLFANGVEICVRNIECVV